MDSQCAGGVSQRKVHEISPHRLSCPPNSGNCEGKTLVDFCWIASAANHLWIEFDIKRVYSCLLNQGGSTCPTVLYCSASGVYHCTGQFPEQESFCLLHFWTKTGDHECPGDWTSILYCQLNAPLCRNQSLEQLASSRMLCCPISC